MTLLDYMTDAEKELMILYEVLNKHFYAGEFILHEDDSKFLKQAKGIVDDIKKKALILQQEEAKKKKHMEESAKEPVLCTVCNQMVEAAIIGEGKNSMGLRVYKRRCSNCGADFFDINPYITSEMLIFMEHTIAKFTTIKNGTSLAQQLNIPEKESERIKESYLNLKAAAEKESEAIEEVKKADEALQLTTKEVTEILKDAYLEVLAKKPLNPD